MLSAFHDAFSLLETLDSNLLEIVIVSLHVSITALVIGCVLGTLVGVLFVAAYFLQQQSSSGLRNIEFNPAARSRSCAA